MKIPKQIKYNGIVYPVKIVEHLDAETNLGRTTFKRPAICLERDMPVAVQEQTFIHELTHIAFRSVGLDWDYKKEEQAVNAWSQNIYGILKDNGLLK